MMQFIGVSLWGMDWSGEEWGMNLEKPVEAP